jgi:hypothetical protein
MRPGWKTTEFWMSLLGHATVIAGIASHFLPPATGAAVMGGITAAYSIGRSIVKANEPPEPPEPAKV